MSVIFLLITASTFVAGIFLVAFIWAVRRGQFDDDVSPAVRILDLPARPVKKPTGPWPTVHGIEDPHSTVAADPSSTITPTRPFTLVH